jgi:hypothetical protein
MAFAIVAPDMLAAAATNVAAVGSTVDAAHMAAAGATTALIPAAADEVSTGIAQLFSRCAHEYHALAGQAAAFNQQFVQHLNAAANSYAATEVSSAASLRPVNPSAALDLSTIGAVQSQLIDTLSNVFSGFVDYVLGLIYYAALVPLYATLVTAFLATLASGLTIATVAFVGNLFLLYLSLA